MAMRFGFSGLVISMAALMVHPSYQASAYGALRESDDRGFNSPLESTGSFVVECLACAKFWLLKAMQHRDWNRTVRPRCDSPRKLVSAHLIRAHLSSVILIGKRRTIDVEGDRVLVRVHAVSSEVDARAETSFFVLVRGSLELISRGKLQTLCTIDLNRVMAIGSEDDKTVGIISVIRSPRTVWEYLVRSGQNPRASNRRGLRSSGKSRHAEKSEEEEISDLHAANVAISQGLHNLIVLNASVSAIYASLPGWWKSR
jgi:hypothetical protein